MNDIKKIVAEHIEWLNNPTKGKRANLQRADLRDAKNIPKSSQTILSILKQQKGNLIAFKYLTGDRSPYNHMLYKVGEIYETNDYNSDERFQCGAGLNVATLDWCLQDTNYNLSKTYIEVEFNAEDIVAIPYNSDGKFRVRKLRVVRKLTQEELEEYIRPLYPSEGGGWGE